MKHAVRDEDDEATASRGCSGTTDAAAVAEKVLGALDLFPSHRVAAACRVLVGDGIDQQQEEAMSGPLLTPRELCERLRISSTTLWRLRPPYIGVGGRKRYRWSDVERFLADRPGGPNEPGARAGSSKAGAV
jgi:hypothetical protein